jgi:hypothetical protein
MLDPTLMTARERISQAVRLLEQLSEPYATQDDGENPADFLAIADSVWRQIVRVRDDKLELWDRIEVDGLHAEDVLARLNDIVYELLLVVLPAS